jgi:hypothetical protein
MLYSKTSEIHVSVFIGHYQVPTIINMSLYKMCVGVLMKRSLCISPLFTMLLVQMLYVNNEKGVYNRKYGDRGFGPGVT